MNSLKREAVWIWVGVGCLVGMTALSDACSWVDSVLSASVGMSTLGVCVLVCRRKQFDPRARSAKKTQGTEKSRSAETFRTLADSIPQLVWSIDSHGKPIHFNRRWFEYSGLTLDQCIQGGWIECLHPEDRDGALNEWKDSVTAVRTFRRECRLRRADGNYRWHLCEGNPVRDQRGRLALFTGTCTDIEISRAEGERVRRHARRMRIQRDRFRELSEAFERERHAREQFVAMLTHDLRNPLSAARMGSQMIIRLKERTEAVPNFAQRVIESLDRADRMITHLLDAQRIRAGEALELKLGSCDLGRIAYDVAREFSGSQGDRIRVRAPNSGLRGTWDSDGLRRVLENLCSNAFKYGRSDGLVTIDLSSDSESVVMSVHNEGSAISQSDLNALFRPWGRLRSARSGPQRGWGLGLLVVQGIIRAHGGQIQVSSHEGEGTRFSMVLPRQVYGSDVAQTEDACSRAAVAI